MVERDRSAHTVPRSGEQSAIKEVKVAAVNVMVDRRGSVWIGSADDGLRRVTDPAPNRGTEVSGLEPQTERFTVKDGLMSNFVYAVFEDREGNIWVGNKRGLERLRAGAFTPVPMPQSTVTRFVAATRDSSVWTGAASLREIVRLRMGRQAKTLSGPETVDLFDDASGRVWSYNRNELFRFNGQEFVRVPLMPQETGRALSISDVVADSGGVVWVFEGVSGRLHRLSGNRLVQVAQLPPPGKVAGTLLSDTRGRLWITQTSRIAMFDRGRLQVFGPAEGVEPGRVSHVVEDHAGNVWAATDAGFSKFEAGKFRTILSRHSIPTGVFDAVEDEAGGWWLLVGNGVLRISPAEMGRALLDSRHVAQFRRFEGLDGLPGALGGTAVQGSQITRAADGVIWVATDSGVASIDPRKLTVGPAPHVLIESIRTDGKEHPVSNTVSVPPRSHNLEIDYTATSLAQSSRVRFRYRLDGADSAWQDAGTRRRAYYSTLPPGGYRFHVIAGNADGVWNETGASITFRVLPAWFQTFWFRAALVLLTAAFGATAAALIQRWRHIQSRTALQAQFDATLSERARIAQDLHDSLLQGFIGVTLQLKAAEGALPARPDVAAETLINAQRLARESLREARERVWDMHEPDRSARDLATALESSARERTLGTGIEIAVVTAGERRRLASAVEDTAIQIGREAIANAVRHAQPRRIDIELDFGTSSLRLEVRDDGRGFTPEQGEEAGRTGHFGLTGIRDRAARAGGQCDVVARPGMGTAVTVRLPLRADDLS
jgi:signal transduction histidine kinase